MQQEMKMVDDAANTRPDLLENLLDQPELFPGSDFFISHQLVMECKQKDMQDPLDLSNLRDTSFSSENSSQEFGTEPLTEKTEARDNDEFQFFKYEIESQKEEASSRADHQKPALVLQSPKSENPDSSCLNSFPRGIKSTDSKGKKKTKSKRGKVRFSQKLSGYPTKNLLPCCKNSHLNYIEALIPSCEEIPIFRKLKYSNKKNKTSITLKDYEDLYSEPRLHKLWQQYFETKQIYRDVIMSKTQLRYKLVFLSKLNVFEVAFKNGVFKSIN